MGHSFHPRYTEKALHFACWPFQIEGEHFNLTPAQRMEVVTRMQAAQHAFAQENNGVSPQLLLICGRTSQTRYRTPTAGIDAGWVYRASPNWGTDRIVMEAMVNEGAYGPIYNLSPQQLEFVKSMLMLTKIGSTGDLDARIGYYLYASCLMRTFFVDAARSVQQRPDERERHREILGFLAGEPTGSYPVLQNVDRHISGEWMRCTPDEGQQVRVRTNGALHNNGQPTRQGVFSRDPLQLEVTAEELDAHEHWGLITNSERQRNNLYFNQNIVYNVN